MAYLIGTDEAGYGPNLGPLVVTASVWRVPSVHHRDLFDQLHRVVRRPVENRPAAVVIGDSKQLYKPGKGLGPLEQNVLASLLAVGLRITTWNQIWPRLAPDDVMDMRQQPWFRSVCSALPRDAVTHEIDAAGDQLRVVCEETSCLPISIVSRVVCAPQFNRLCDQTGNKASALSHVSLHLIRSVLETVPNDQPAYILCDKHGGRNKYGPLLNDVFPESLALVREESRAQSVYHMGSGASHRELVFRAKADADFLPSALASMVSKYLRELAMLAFNQFWMSHVPALNPTAGYPVDAKRFKQDIADKQMELDVDDWSLWRNR